MKKLFAAILLATACLVPAVAAEAPGVAAAPSAPVLPVATFRALAAGQPRVVVTYGTSLTHKGAWVGELSTWLSSEFPGLVTFHNAARSGMTSDWGVANLSARVLAHKPDLVFIEFSANDAATKNNISQEKSRANLDAMIRALREQNPAVEIILQTMNPAWDSPKTPDKKYGSERPELAAYYAVYRDYARDHSLPLVDNYPVWKRHLDENPSSFQRAVSDGIHPHSGPSKSITWPAVKSLLEAARAAAAKS